MGPGVGMALNPPWASRENAIATYLVRQRGVTETWETWPPHRVPAPRRPPASVSDDAPAAGAGASPMTRTDEIAQSLRASRRGVQRAAYRGTRMTNQTLL